MAALPRPRLTGLAPLLLLAAALAGCASQPPEPEPAQPALEPAGDEGLPGAGAGGGGAAPEEGQSEFARALDEKFHAHNYWGSSLEKLLMDADVPSAPVLPSGQFGVFVALFRAGFGGGVGFTPFELPEGSIVPPEAHRVEVAVRWAASPTITGLRLAYSTARNESVTLLDPLPEGGGTYAIATGLEDNDIPHTSVSRWRFFLVPHRDGGPGVFNGSAHVTVKAFRNDTLFVAPPHPDHWGEATRLSLLEAHQPLKGTRVLFPVGRSAEEAGFASVELPNGTIVPPHTAALTLRLAWQNNASLDPFGTRPDLAYSPANTRGFLRPETQEAGDGEATYVVPLTPRMWDSPYAAESGWAFLVFLRSGAPTDQGFFGGVGQFDGAFTLSVVAEREAL